jgi:hypothetical protein
VVTLQRRREAEIREGDEDGFFADTLLEYQWARDVAGLAPSTLEKLIKPVIEVAGYYGLPAWRLTPRQVDKYFAGPGKRAPATVRQKLNRIDGYFAFLGGCCSFLWRADAGGAVSVDAGGRDRRVLCGRDAVPVLVPSRGFRSCSRAGCGPGRVESG